MLMGLFALLSTASVACQSSAVVRIERDNDPAEPFVLSTTNGQYRLAGQDFIHPRDWHRGDHLQVCAQSGPGGWVKVVNTTRGETLAGQTARQRVPSLTTNP